jgi:hypothetical protein
MRWWGRFLPLVLLTLVVLLSGSQNAQNLVQPSPAHDSEKRQPNSAVVNAASHANPPEAQEPRPAPDQSEHDAKDKLTRYDFWSLVAQYLIFVATLIYASVAIYQLWAIHRQADIAAEATAVAKKSVEIAKLSLHLDRPYLITHSFELEGFPLANDAEGVQRAQKRGLLVEGRFSIKNFGKGPALMNEMLVCIKAVEKVPASRDYAICNRLDDFLKINVLNADSETEQGREFLYGSITPEDYGAIIVNKKTLIFYGIIRYRDVFEGVYETGFCWQYSAPGGGMGDDMPGFLYQWAGHRKTHNFNT